MSPTTFDQLSSVTRLSHKYNIGDLEDQAIRCLKALFTDSWEVFIHDGDRFFQEIEVLPVHAIGVVNLARLTGTPSILPSALYLCCQLGSTIFDGWTREDGQTEHLSREDLRRYVDGRMALTREALPILLDIFDVSAIEDCKSRRVCDDGIKKTTMDAMGNAHASEPSIFYSWSEVIQRGARAYGICNTCKALLLSRDDETMKRTWAKLPDLMGVEVDDWETPDGD